MDRLQEIAADPNGPFTAEDDRLVDEAMGVNDWLDPEVQPMETEGRLTYLAFGPEPVCSHCDQHFDTHIPGKDYVYYCPEWALRQKWGDR